MRGKEGSAFRITAEGRQGTDSPAPAGSNSLAIPGSGVGNAGVRYAAGRGEWEENSE